MGTSSGGPGFSTKKSEASGVLHRIGDPKTPPISPISPRYWPSPTFSGFETSCMRSNARNILFGSPRMSPSGRKISQAATCMSFNSSFLAGNSSTRYLLSNMILEVLISLRPHRRLFKLYDENAPPVTRQHLQAQSTPSPSLDCGSFSWGIF